MNIIKSAVLIFGLAASFLFAGVANATLIYASSATNIDTGTGQGTSNDRDNINNLFGAADGTFYELGNGGSVDLQFGEPTGQLFSGNGFITEITFGARANFFETASIFAGLAGNFVFVAEIDNSIATTQFAFGGPFDTLRIVDTTPVRIGGFDIDSVAVARVPEPSTIGLLMLALGVTGFARASKKSAKS